MFNIIRKLLIIFHSFGCPCGVDELNENQTHVMMEMIMQNGNVVRRAMSKKHGRKKDSSRIVGGEDLKNPSPWFLYLLFGETGSFQ